MPPQQTDVLICGSGSAGLSAATWLSLYNIPYKILERRSGPIEIGQADGVQCRTVEIFESFGLGEELLREAYHVLEVAFWADDGSGSGSSSGAGVVKRMGRTADTQRGLSHLPHVILNQARINGLFIQAMRGFGGGEIEYGWDVRGVNISGDGGDGGEYPVRVRAVGEGGVEEIFEAKYVLACDGAHSTVRKALGLKMVGDSSDAVWGVMDMVPRTDFPDIRKKVSIRSQAGNLLIIPREGENYNLTRFYIELPPGTKAKDVKLEDLQQAARSILSQYEVEFTETVWWSAYSIGQRYADFFHKDYRVFLGGDACHTHSPKAGQGMNVSLQDGYNMGWKLAHVLKGLAPASLLETYVLERQKVAIDLINFDRYFSKLFSTGGKASATEFQEGFIKAGKYTAGLTAKYEESPITNDLGLSDSLAKNIVVGMRLPSSQVVRYCDSKPVQLASAMKSDGRWRVMVFVGDTSLPQNKTRLDAIGAYLSSAESPLQTFRFKGGDSDSLIEPILVGHGARHDIELDQIHPAFYPVTGKNQIKDLHKIFFDDESYNKGHGQLYEHLGINPQNGVIVIVRPDQYKHEMTFITTNKKHPNMALKFNYTVAPHLEEFNLPFPTFRATRPELTHFIGGGLIFSQAAIKTTHHDNPDEEDGVEGEKYPRILLLQRSYEDSWGGHWEGPGGSCEPEDETLLAGVAREIFEESGLHVSRFVELVAIDNWVKTRPDQVIVAAKFTFIVEVHEARSAGSGTGTSTGQHDEEQAGLPADKLEDGGVVPGLSRRWEDAIKLDPAEHRAFEWVTEEEVRDSDGDKAGKFKSFGQQGKTILKAFRMLSEKA
ncbi:FAD binding domain-containing protein [Aspergillus cavernicola]|uniref:FAD binding domain-containing protein n=1 Tax=Aspergillus cavernicola TaxID=176166 RepID=A0ABR4IKT2_9EURO